MAVATAQDVHSTMAGFAALFEGAVDWRACGAVAVEVALAAREQRAPTAANAKAIWNRMVATGHVAKNAKGQVTSTFLGDLYWYLHEEAGYPLDWMDYSRTPNLAALHQFIKDATLAGDPVVALLTNGQAMPDNERAVAGHFVALGGIDSKLGYLTANGDTQTAIRTGGKSVPLNWATWATLVRAGLAGAIRVHTKVAKPSPTPPPAPAEDEAAEAAKVAALRVAVATALSASQQAVSTAQAVSAQVEALEKALSGL